MRGHARGGAAPRSVTPRSSPTRPGSTSAEVGTFPEDPRLAIDGGESGFDLVRACLEVIGRHLADDGFAVLQVGPDGQAEEVADHLRDHPELDLVVSAAELHDRGTLVLLRRSDGSDRAKAT